MMIGSTAVPRRWAASVPIPMPSTSQMTAAPRTREKVTGAAWVICGITFVPRLTKDSRSRSMKRCRIISAYCTGSGRSRPNECRT